MSPHPEVLWAQRSDKLYLTVSLPDAKDVSVSCQILWLPDAVSGKLELHSQFIFKASRDQHESYNFTLDLYGLIKPNGFKTKTSSRNTLCSIQKGERGWWKRLLRSEEKPAPYIKVDWNKWCDEDEESDSELISDDDDGQVAGEDDESSDDEGMLYLPDLKKAVGK